MASPGRYALPRALSSLLLAAAWVTGGSALLLTSCSQGGGEGDIATTVEADVKDSYSVGDVSFDMVRVEGGTLALGTVRDGRMIKGVSVPARTILSSYAIMETPVSQALWTAVMGSNPSSTASADLPVDRVSAGDCRAFAAKLSKLTGTRFFLPTEAQWEYAVKTGLAGTVKDLREWCHDSYAESYPPGVLVNPVGEGKGPLQVVRTAAGREGVVPSTKAGALSFRLAVYTSSEVPADFKGAMLSGIDRAPRDKPLPGETIRVGEQAVEMVPVAAGSFYIGATMEQGKYAEEDENPVMNVDVEDFLISRTEVTVGLYGEVMGSLPLGNDPLRPSRPVINVSWYDAQEFIVRLTRLTGRPFRLPTEKEWEYAARGGDKIQPTRYSGSNDVVKVAAHSANAKGQAVVDVRSFAPNPIGLYDMSGNAWEWCNDLYAPYGGTPPEGSDLRVQRGGSAASPFSACRVSNRASNHPYAVKGTYGFRLAI